MGLDYTINGSVNVRECPEVTAIVDKIYERLSSDALTIAPAADGIITIEINYSDYQTIHCPEEMDGLLKDLEQYVVGDAGGHFVIEMYGEEDDRYIGNKEQREWIKRTTLVERIKEIGTQVELDDDYMSACGAGVAKVLQLKRDPEHKDRWRTTWGSKTNLGLAKTILRMADEMRSKTFDAKG